MVSPIQPGEDPIRVYPGEYPQEDVDVANQIVHDLRGTFGYRAVALHGESGEVLEWYASNNGVLEYWPDHFEDPTWNRWSIYAFLNRPTVDDGDGYFALHPWQEELQEDAEPVG